MSHFEDMFKERGRYLLQVTNFGEAAITKLSPQDEPGCMVCGELHDVIGTPYKNASPDSLLCRSIISPSCLDYSDTWAEVAEAAHTRKPTAHQKRIQAMLRVLDTIGYPLTRWLTCESWRDPLVLTAEAAEYDSKRRQHTCSP